MMSNGTTTAKTSTIASTKALLLLITQVESPQRRERTQSHPAPARVKELGDGLQQQVRRATESFGLAVRPSEALIDSLAVLNPSEEKGGPSSAAGMEAYHPSRMFLHELTEVLRISADELVTIIGDHLCAADRSLTKEIADEVDLLKKAGLIVELPKLSEGFRKADLDTRVRKACDDLRDRLLPGGYAASFVNMPRASISSVIAVPLEAIRYPMQFAGLLTYLAIPLALALGFRLDSSGASVIKSSLLYVLVALVPIAYFQVRARRAAAVETALSTIKRQLKTELSKTGQEIGKIISDALQLHLTTRSMELTATLIEPAQDLLEQETTYTSKKRKHLVDGLKVRLKAMERQLKDEERLLEVEDRQTRAARSKSGKSASSVADLQAVTGKASGVTE